MDNKNDKLVCEICCCLLEIFYGNTSKSLHGKYLKTTDVNNNISCWNNWHRLIGNLLNGKYISFHGLENIA